jgi:hypothetical protein
LSFVKIVKLHFKNLFLVGFSVDLQCPKIAHNEKGLAFVGELEFRQPITEAQ